MTDHLRVVKTYWYMFLLLGLAIISWIGWMNERTDKLAYVERLAEDLREYRDGSTQLKEQILDEVQRNKSRLDANKEKLDALLDAQRAGPRHTACDTKQILGDLRSGGKVAPHYPVEDRCNNAN